jgi:membrane protease YdiL (CAAX protease family)
MNFKTIISWKLFFVLLPVCVIASLLVIPYSLALSPVKVEITPVLVLLSMAQNLVLFALASFFGLLLSKQVGMGLPIVQGMLEGKNKNGEIKAMLPISVAWGIVSGILIILLSIPFQALSVDMLKLEVIIAPWKGFLASFYGGIAEEVLCRLFIVSLFAWIGFKIKKTKEGLPTKTGVWISIVLAAVLFGLGHLPLTGTLTELNFIVVLRAIVLNGAGGVIFGWLFWRKGLESAIIAHFSADIVLHVITPLVASLFLQ